MLIRFLGAIVMIAAIIAGTGLSGRLAALIHVPSILFVGGIVGGGLLWSFGFRHTLSTLSAACGVGQAGTWYETIQHEQFLTRAKQLAISAGVIGRNGNEKGYHDAHENGGQPEI